MQRIMVATGLLLIATQAQAHHPLAGIDLYPVLEHFEGPLIRAISS